MKNKVINVFLVVQVIWLDPTNGNKFPEDFVFGVSTAAYQSEGAWTEDGKGMSIWDYLTHTDPAFIDDKTNADVAADSYHLYKRDVEMLIELGVSSYKFSISWPRILPNGLATHVNHKGIEYYHKLIDELLEKGIKPFVTMYHWDLPQYLQEKGGVLSDEFPKWFGDYARVLYQHFGNKVRYWMTINEPSIHCMIIYEVGTHAPRTRLPGRGYYDCNRNLLLAHAKAYHIYEEFRPTQKGKISINVQLEWPVASTNSSDDREAVLDYTAFRFGLTADPVFSEKGNYPQRVINRVALMSAKQGLNSSRLKPLTDEEIKYIRGTADYLPLNHYSSDKVYRNSSILGKYESPSLWEDEFLGTCKDPAWERNNNTPSLWSNPQGFYDLLLYVKNTYNNPQIYIIENGFVTNKSTSNLNDNSRVSCLRDYLRVLQNAMEAGVDVKGYFAWSLMDSFEWARGYSVSFGLYDLDINDLGRRRTARKSALVYKEIIRSRVIDYDYNPDPLNGQNGANMIAIHKLIGLVTSIMLVLILH